MNTAFQSQIPSEARARVLQSLGFSSIDPECVVGPALFAEAIRCALWAYWTTEQAPIYVTRILNAAVRLVYPWLLDSEGNDGEKQLKTHLRFALEELETIGDIAPLPHGRWLPAPLRSVQLDSIERWLLLGGAPTKLLPIPAQRALEQSGVARLLPQPPDRLDLALDTQAEMEWRRVPSAAIDAWTTAALQNVPLTPIANQDERVEVYAPERRYHPTQYHRWVPGTTRLPDGRYLARWRLHHGSSAYSIVEFQHWQLAAIGHPDLGDGDVRRLMYGIDCLLKRPVQVRIKRKPDFWRFTLRSELPRAEHRLFMALGRLQPNADGAYYPRYWDASVRYAPQLEAALNSLGVKIV
jgi:hypothetical protein